MRLVASIDLLVSHLRHSLTALDLFSVPVTDISLLLLTSKLPQLKRLECCSGRLSDRGLVGFGRMRELERLNLSHNPGITSRGVTYLGPLAPTLTSLSLSYCSLDASVVPRLTAFRELRQLTLYGTRVPKGGLDKLHGEIRGLQALRYSD